MKFFITICLISLGTLANASSGCLVNSGKKVRIDTKCKCLETKTCAVPAKLKYSKKFFETKRADNSPVFDSNEKLAYEKLYKLYNNIMELKGQGKDDTEEAKKNYFELDKLNSEISIMLHKRHPEVMSAFKKRYAEKSKKRKELRAKTDLAIKKFLKNKDANSLPLGLSSTTPLNSKPVENSGVKESIKAVNSSVPEQVLPNGSVGSERFTDYDKKEIVKSLNKERQEISEDDSLFDIISKTYRGKAYKRLWAPENLENSEESQ